MGFIELNSGSRLQMEREKAYYEERKRVVTEQEVADRLLYRSEFGRNNNDGNSIHVENRTARGGNAGLSANALEAEGAGDSSGVEADSQGVVESDAIAQKNTSDRGVMLQIRMTSDNKMYVQADRQVIHGNDSSLWEQQIIDYVNESVRKGKDVVIPTEDI